MQNSVIVNDDGEIRVGIILYGYRITNHEDTRLRLSTLENPENDMPIVSTRILVDSESFDGQSGTYDVIEIDARAPIHDKLDDESSSGWLEGGRIYQVGKHVVTTLTANEIIELSDSIFTIVETDGKISY